MYSIMLSRSIVFGLLLAFLLMVFSASSCDSYKTGTDYRTIAWNDALDAGISPQYFVNQINIESGFNPSAYSSEGAQGIAQFMPRTASGLGIDPWEPIQSLRGAAQLMSRYVAKYGTFRHALAAYNCGSGCLNWAIRNCLDFYWCIPYQTRHYIDIIMV